VKADLNTTLGETASRCGGRILAGDPHLVIRTVTSDSRELGEASLFVPLIGDRFDGHDFISALAGESKIAAFLTMRENHAGIARSTGTAAILCADTLSALGSIAAGHRDRIDPVIIGVTGTNGKTTTKELIHSMAALRHHALKNVKNYNNEIGVPFTLLGLAEFNDMAVIEMGMNHSGELDRLSRIVRPDMAVITNVGEGHLEFLGSVENVAYAKAEIMHGMEPGSLVFINRDTDCFGLLADQAAKAGLRVRTFGLGVDADLFPSSYRLSRESVELEISGKALKAPLYGIHNLYNVLAAVSVGVEIGLDMRDIQSALDRFQNVGGRSQIVDRGYIVIDDTYNSNPLSTRYALRSAAEVFPGSRKIAVLSDMKELGRHAESFHEECGREAAHRGMSLLYLWGEMAAHYRTGAVRAGMQSDSVVVFGSKSDLAQSLKQELREKDVVLVKGSRSMKMEEIVKEITA